MIADLRCEETGTFLAEISRLNSDLVNSQRELARQNAELVLLSAEKSALLRELQHRAKNSLGMISSMIQLMTLDAGAPETQAALGQLNARVMSVAELYTLLYSSGSFNETRLDEYCAKVASVLVSLRAGISLVTEMEPVVVSAHRAAPIGLILTELITNSLKYAFPDGRKGRVALSLCKGRDSATLEIRDDGVGMPSDFDLSGTGGTGIMLVEGLSKQVGGTLTMVGSEAGTTCTLEFPA
jgi:two-component sensor histidine kinase